MNEWMSFVINDELKEYRYDDDDNDDEIIGRINGDNQ